MQANRTCVKTNAAARRTMGSSSMTSRVYISRSPGRMSSFITLYRSATT